MVAMPIPLRLRTDIMRCGLEAHGPRTDMLRAEPVSDRIDMRMHHRLHKNTIPGRFDLVQMIGICTTASTDMQFPHRLHGI